MERILRHNMMRVHRTYGAVQQRPDTPGKVLTLAPVCIIVETGPGHYAQWRVAEGTVVDASVDDFVDRTASLPRALPFEALPFDERQRVLAAAVGWPDDALSALVDELRKDSALSFGERQARQLLELQLEVRRKHIDSKQADEAPVGDLLAKFRECLEGAQRALPLLANAEIRVRPLFLTRRDGDGVVEGYGPSVVELALLPEDEELDPLISLTVGPFTGTVNGQPLTRNPVDWTDIGTLGNFDSDEWPWLVRVHRGFHADLRLANLPEAQVDEVCRRLRAAADECLAMVP